jgi:hypothetical protein
MRTRMPLPLLFVTLWVVTSDAQVIQAPVSRDATVSQIASVISGRAPVTDVVLTGSAEWHQGSKHESGSFTIKAKGFDDSRLDMNLSGGLRSELRTRQSNKKIRGVETAPGSTPAPLAIANSWTDAAWFFPTLSSIANPDPSIVVEHVGKETRDGLVVEHIRTHRTGIRGTTGAVALIEKLSTTDFFIDPATSLPIAVTFAAHPAQNALTDYPVEIRFSNYQTVSGVPIPFHVQKFMNRVLQLDLTIQSASVNTGLTDVEFAAPVMAGGAQ